MYDVITSLVKAVHSVTASHYWHCQIPTVNWQWACSITTAEDLLRRSEGKQNTYKSSGQKQKYILPLTLTWVSLKSMWFHTATYRSFLSFCDQDGRQRSIPSGPFWQIEWREYNLLFLEGHPCGNRVHPLTAQECMTSYMKVRAYKHRLIHQWVTTYMFLGCLSVHLFIVLLSFDGCQFMLL